MSRMNHRICSESVAGRRLTQAKGARIADDSTIPPAILEHNRKVDEARAARLAARKKGKT